MEGGGKRKDGKGRAFDGASSVSAEKWTVLRTWTWPWIGSAGNVQPPTAM